MTTQNKNVPALRFLGFNEDWQLLKIKQFVIDKKGAMKIGPFGSQLKKDTFVDSGFKVYGQENIFANDFSFGNRYISTKHFEQLKSNELFSGDFVISTMGTIGKCAVMPSNIERGIMDSHMIRLQLDQTKISSDFLTQLFSLFKTLKQIKNLSVGGIMDGLSMGIINELKFHLPTLPEQQRIAAFLTVVDEKIQQLTKKKDLLEQYKKGVMQKIFNQEIRFKDYSGNDFADWELTELKEIAVRVTAKNKSNNIKYVLTNSATRGIVSQQDYFDKDIANQNNLEGYYIVEKDDFVYNPRISSFAPVGPIKRNNLKKGLMSPLYSVFRFKDVNLDFIEQFFETRLWHDYLKSIANYGARHDRMNITVEAFFDMPILLPTKPEQEEIADFLAAIDYKINSVNQQLEKTKEYKKGLLQQMFI